VRNALLNESFRFIANGTVIESVVAESAALFPAVREQLLVDGCARKFVLKGGEMEAAAIRSLQLLLSGESISIRRSQGLLSVLLGNVNLEPLFLGCSKADIRENLSDLVKEMRIDLESADVSALSLEALDNLLLSESVSVKSEDALLRFILKLGPGYRDLLRHIQIGFLSKGGLSLLEEHFGIPPESLWQCAAEWIAHPLSPLDSRIISEFPDIFAEFKGKHFELLWRGSRDGFKAQEFHRLCDGHTNTLTVILDTKGNIFGGFTPLEWESSEVGEWKRDRSLKSFLFTLTNPHNLPPKRFPLKAKRDGQAILCHSEHGPHFGEDIAVADEGNINPISFAVLATAYTKDPEVRGYSLFTGSFTFRVKEIEVFEIRD
jgi:hypothetical protein